MHQKNRNMEITTERSSRSSESGTWWSFSPWGLGITSWVWASYSLTCLWEEEGEGSGGEVTAYPLERGLMLRNARILSVSMSYGTCFLVLCRIYFIFGLGCGGGKMWIGELGRMGGWGGKKLKKEKEGISPQITLQKIQAAADISVGVW